MNVSNIKEKVENCDSFQYWSEAIGLSFEDFYIIDKDTNKTIKTGKDDIGFYWVYIENNQIYGIGYDMDNEIVRKHNLKKVA